MAGLYQSRSPARQGQTSKEPPYYLTIRSSSKGNGAGSKFRWSELTEKCIIANWSSQDEAVLFSKKILHGDNGHYVRFVTLWTLVMQICCYYGESVHTGRHRRRHHSCTISVPQSSTQALWC